MAILRIKRKNGFIDSLRDYSLFVDGVKIGMIENSETKDFEIPAGKHLVMASIDWCSSQELSIEVIDNECSTLLVGGIKNGNLILPLMGVMLALSLLLPQSANIFYKLFLVIPPFAFFIYIYSFGRKHYLTLKEIGRFTTE